MALACQAPMKATSNGAFQGENPLNYAIPLIIIHICIVVAFTRLLAFDHWWNTAGTFCHWEKKEIPAHNFSRKEHDCSVEEFLASPNGRRSQQYSTLQYKVWWSSLYSTLAETVRSVV
ncbi:hypothetical protein Dsin_029353 [Dipteronia sinensis]|uniref:Uncharacterized protein n=1 Tax=Dipteronia sinensis TaxID=43782 RepID=A0AAE0DWM8_9ROSI|nr:hypothetical protein Dsin_029353 [Dipteronia sinensis]